MRALLVAYDGKLKEAHYYHAVSASESSFHPHYHRQYIVPALPQRSSSASTKTTITRSISPVLISLPPNLKDRSPRRWHHDSSPSSESFHIHTIVHEVVVVVKTELVALHTTALSVYPRCSYEPPVIFGARNFDNAAIAIKL